MGINRFQLLLVFVAGMLLQACPNIGEEDCGDPNQYYITSEKLITVHPEKSIFPIGDTLWIEGKIDKLQTTNYNTEIDIYDETGVSIVEVGSFLRKNVPDTVVQGVTFNTGIPYFLETTVEHGYVESRVDAYGFNHVMIFAKLEQDKYWFKVGYILNELGDFLLFHPAIDSFRIVFSKGNDCGETYTVYTNLANPNNGYGFSFEVTD